MSGKAIAGGHLTHARNFSKGTTTGHSVGTLEWPWSFVFHVVSGPVLGMGKKG